MVIVGVMTALMTATGSGLHSKLGDPSSRIPAHGARNRAKTQSLYPDHDAGQSTHGPFRGTWIWTLKNDPFRPVG